jgi:hypothetical protein
MTRSTTTNAPALPRWLKPANRVIVILQRLGIAFLSFHLLTVPGRRTGRLHTTPVSPFWVDGRRYVLSLARMEWVRNARACGWGILARGRRTQRVRVVELGPEERVPVVRRFPAEVRGGVRFFVQLGLVRPPADADAFAAAAPDLAVFRIDPQE